MKRIKNFAKPLLVLGIVLAVFLIGCEQPGGGSSCSGSTAQGWSGFTPYKNSIIFGSMEGRVIALNPQARTDNKTYPAEGEWHYQVKNVTPGAACGAMCVPAGGTSTGFYSTPAVAGELLVVGTYAGRIYAFNADRGALRWVYPRESFETVGAIVAPIITDGKSLYVGSSNNKLYSLDADTGDFRWEFPTSDKIWVAPAVDNGIVYVGNYAGEVFALSAETGKPVWNIKVPSAVASSLTVYKDYLYFGTFDRNLYAIDKSSGKERWKFSGGNWFWAQPIAYEGVVYVTCLDHNVYALDAESGREIWRFTAESPIPSSVSISDNYLYTVCDKGIVYKLDTQNGKALSNVYIGFAVLATPYANGDMVYIYARDHNVYAVNTSSRTVVWKFSSFLE